MPYSSRPAKGRVLLVSLLLLLLLFTLFPGTSAARWRFSPSDAGQRFQEQPPVRVVSLVPSATETLFALGAGNAVAGVTLQDKWPPEVSEKPVVGGFFAPFPERILALAPDLIIAADLHEDVRRAASGQVPVLTLTTESLEGAMADMARLGKLFHRSEQAEKTLRTLRDQLARIGRKVAQIPEHQRKRVIRLMGRNAVMAPGDDSFQNDLIQAAGGIPPRLGQNGKVVPVSLNQWTTFNPQVIYGCGGDRKSAETLLDRPGWGDVDAVKNHRLFFFPCDLTCRVSPNTGAFVAWLAARIYPEELGANSGAAGENEVVGRRPLSLDLPWIQRAEVLSCRVGGFSCKTLILDFDAPMTVVSTLEGERHQVLTVGNHYKSMAAWTVNHATDVPTLKKDLCARLGKNPASASFLFTGADLDHLSVQRQAFRDMAVIALVTAGVTSNALRMGKDAGGYYEPGTINILLLTNMRLTPRAMTRAVLTATEAKSAALDDLDIRSSASPLPHGATGTGTDNIIVVQGRGQRLDNAGGHSKLGELLAKAVYRGVREAVYRQNGINGSRSVIRRLNERGIFVHDLLEAGSCDCRAGKTLPAAAVEKILMDPEYAGFLSAALAVSDAGEKGLVQDFAAFDRWALSVAGKIAGQPLARIEARCPVSGLPRALQTAVNAVLTGTAHRLHLDTAREIQ